MSDSKELMLKEQSHVSYIDQNLDLIANQNKLNPEDLKNFAIQCKRTGLDPITRQIYAIPNNGKLTIMASIDGLRLIAERSGEYEGQTAPQWCGDDGIWKDVWLSKETPRACKIGVYKTKFREPLVAIAIFEEYAGRHLYDDTKYGKYEKGDLTHMWAKMPALMIAKVAEALALRKAFPNEMSGIYSTEEMDQANITQKNERDVNVSSAIEGHKVESKQYQKKVNEPLDLNAYVIQFGKKMAGKRLNEFTIDEHRSMLTWLQEQSEKNNRPLNGPAKEYSDYATAYIIEQSKEKPLFDETEKLD